MCQGEERLRDEQGKKLHSTQKPEELLYWVLAINSNIGNLVLDPFGGTMTTGVLAKKMGRDYIMIERDAGYCRAGKARLDTVAPVITDIEKAAYDVKEMRVTMNEMILSGYFVLGERFFLKDRSASAILLEGGKLKLGEKTVDLHSEAALAMSAKADRLNGFAHWYVERENRLVSINEIRAAYRKGKSRSSN